MNSEHVAHQEFDAGLARETRCSTANGKSSLRASRATPSTVNVIGCQLAWSLSLVLLQSRNEG